MEAGHQLPVHCICDCCGCSWKLGINYLCTAFVTVVAILGNSAFTSRGLWLFPKLGISCLATAAFVTVVARKLGTYCHPTALHLDKSFVTVVALRKNLLNVEPRSPSYL